MKEINFHQNEQDNTIPKNCLWEMTQHEQKDLGESLKKSEAQMGIFDTHCDGFDYVKFEIGHKGLWENVRKISVSGKKAHIPSNGICIIDFREKVLSAKAKDIIMESRSGKESMALYDISDLIISHIEIRKRGTVLYYFDGRIWKQLDGWETLKIITSKYNFDWHRSIQRSKWKEILSNIQTQIDEFDELETMSEDYSKYVCFRNGVYSIENDTMLKHAPEYPFTSYFNFDFNPNQRGKAKYFEQYLESASDGDKRVAKRMLQWMAYSCSELPNVKKFALVLGEPNSGKSTFADIICHIVGEENAKGIDLNGVGRFSNSDVAGMKVVTCTDLRPDKLSSNAAEWLKIQTGNDLVHAEIKYVNGSFSYRSKIKFIFASNYNVDMFDSTLRDRALIIPMKHSLLPDEIDPYLTDHIVNELQYVFVQMFDALREFIKNGMQFEDIGELENYTPRSYLYGESSVSDFFRYRCYYAPDKKISRSELYQKYENFCMDNCYEKVSKTAFGKEFAMIVKSHNEIKNGKSSGVRYYKNIGISDVNCDDNSNFEFDDD